MSTTTQPTIDLSRPGIPFGRAVSVEVRKMFDTRGGLWLFICTGGMMVLLMGLILLVMALNDGSTITANGFMQAMIVPLSILLPVFAILTLTTEWGQRTHLVTFSIEPRRGRVVAAKLAAVTILALGTMVLAGLVGALGNVLYGAITGNEMVWNVSAKDLAWTAALQLIYFLMAFAIASVFLSTPGAIAVFYVIALILPFVVYTTLWFMFGWARDVIPWLDFNYAAAPLQLGTDFFGEPVDVGAYEYLRFAGSVTLLVILPGLFGIRRVLRTEVK
ncbi:hypothetical protein [Aeromicrobium sp. 179-A 4D2 NHS]|uniref:hypothetical protein n=1 Tax=Aeromicrobium sp. 179-A 4D2 NHS TaxID=3142375 RepID=UPI00399F1E32